MVGLSVGALSLAFNVFKVGFISVDGVGLFVEDMAKLSVGALSFAVDVFEVSVTFVVVASLVDVLVSLSAALIVFMVSETDGSSAVFAFAVDLSVAGLVMSINCKILFDS